MTLEPGVFDVDVVARQLTAMNVVEAARIRSMGYPVRISTRDFIDRFVPFALPSTLGNVTKWTFLRTLNTGYLTLHNDGDESAVMKQCYSRGRKEPINFLPAIKVIRKQTCRLIRLTRIPCPGLGLVVGIVRVYFHIILQTPVQIVSENFQDLIRRKSGRGSHVTNTDRCVCLLTERLWASALITQHKCHGFIAERVPQPR